MSENEVVAVEQIWCCPFCGKEIDEHAACCGEVGHAELVDVEKESS